MHARLLTLVLLSGILGFAAEAQDAPLAATLAGTSPDKYVPGRVLVRFRPGRSPAAHTAAHFAAGAAFTTPGEQGPALGILEMAGPSAVPQALASDCRTPHARLT